MKRFLLWLTQKRIARWVRRDVDARGGALQLVRLRRLESHLLRRLGRPNLVRLVRISAATLASFDEGIVGTYGYPSVYVAIEDGTIKLWPVPQGDFELYIMDRGPASAGPLSNFPPADLSKVSTAYQAASFVSAEDLRAAPDEKIPEAEDD